MNLCNSRSGFAKFIVLVVILITILVLIEYVFKSKTPSSPSPHSTTTEKSIEQKGKKLAGLPINDKMRRAEAYLRNLKKELDDFFMTMKLANPSPQELQKHMKKYNKIINGYTRKMDALKLTCPKSSPQYSSYTNWTRDFQQRDRKIMEESNTKVEDILRKAGFSKR